MKNFFTAFLIIFFCSLQAQQVKHTAQQGEGLYGISKKYKVSIDAIKRANPYLNSRGLLLGDVLLIPGKGGIEVSTIKSNNLLVGGGEYRYVEVLPKQTIYSLTKQLSISEAALRSLNPQLKNGLKAGDIVRVPKTATQVPAGMHLVQSKETMYAISKKYGLSIDALYGANFDLQTEGLKANTYIKIPSKKVKTDVKHDGFLYHSISKGETIFSIINTYEVSLASLRKHNLFLIEGLSIGQKLKIPLRSDARLVGVEPIKRKANDSINVVLMMPFGLGISGMTKERSMSKDFYYGSELAVKQLAKKGKRIKLTLVDTKNDKKVIEDFFAGYDLSTVDVVIGPAFNSNVLNVAEILSQSDIPVVSPFSSSEELEEFENVIIASPKKTDLANRVIREINADYTGQKIVILTTNKEMDLAIYTKKELKKKHPRAEIVVSTQLAQVQQSMQIIRMADSQEGTIATQSIAEPLLAVLASSNASLGRSFVLKLNSLDPNMLKAYGIGYVSEYDKRKNDLKKIGFAYSMSRRVNVYGTNEKQTMADFKQSYCVSSPSKYGQIGYDITYDIVDRMNANGDLLPYLRGSKTRLSTKFDYQKIKGGAYLNKGVRLIKLFTKTATKF